MTAEPDKNSADSDKKDKKDEPASGSSAEAGKAARATRTADGATGEAGGSSDSGSNGSAMKTVVDRVKPVSGVADAEKVNAAAGTKTFGTATEPAPAGASRPFLPAPDGRPVQPAQPATPVPAALAQSSYGHNPAAAGTAGPLGMSGSAGPGGAGDTPSGSAVNRADKAGSLAASGKNPRKAHLQLSRLEPWSVMKFSFVMSLVAFIVLLVAVVVLWLVLSGLGVFDAISNTVNDLTREQGESKGALNAASWFSFAHVFGYTVLVGAVNVLLITALSTVGSVMYNTAADLVGGVEVTLKEAE